MKMRSREQGMGIRFTEAWVYVFLLLVSMSGSALLATDTKKVEAPPFEGEILGMKVAARSMALVLDVSGSMRPFLSSIRNELQEKTPRNPTLHVDGCVVEKPDPRPQIKNGVAPETITAIDALATHTTATTILWITDMADPPNVDGVVSLEKLLRDRGLQLLLISVKNGPIPSLKKVIEGREGYWKVIDSQKLR